MSASTTPPRSPDHPVSERVDADGDRISVTDVNGTIARFEMTYEAPSAGEKTKFGPPRRARIPSALYLLASAIFGVVTICAYNAPTSSKLFVWAVEGDRIRPLSVSVIAVILMVSSLATVLRTHMRGVIVTDDWVEARSLLALGIPKARRWGWPQVTRLVVDGDRIGFEMYDGSFERLPEVADGKAMAQLMMHHAQRLRIDVTVLERLATRR
ncbi:MAG TPA: hypothetical protein VGL81_14625 [Polyangiaceae bacterium]